ncbi:hypothetical protein AAFF_G00006710 [Aldrovandia affinis]|uniref:Uncharacterized protein n=1 Tax=Aldrovandia affinis TaxID=143900 RepID=A0AAD7X3R1_9TELE|nr:hypothetical protein AAFF_G00006710 [Aldrovandia affinis]
MVPHVAVEQEQWLFPGTAGEPRVRGGAGVARGRYSSARLPAPFPGSAGRTWGAPGSGRSALHALAGANNIWRCIQMRGFA